MQYVVHFRIKSAIVHNFISYFLLVLQKESIFIRFFKTTFICKILSIYMFIHNIPYWMVKLLFLDWWIRL